MVKILLLSGSSRTDSLNQKLLKAAGNLAKEQGAEITFVDLVDDVLLPLFDPNLNDLPENAIKLKEMMYAHDAFFVAAPEYNSSITPLLKNAIDWASRPHKDDEPMCSAFAGKIVGLMACSPGVLGGLRGLDHVREIFMNMGSVVAPKMAAVGNGFQAFDANGVLADEKQAALVQSVVDQVLELAK